AGNLQAGRAVAGDDIARDGGVAADRIVMRAARDSYSQSGKRKRGCARGIGADKVALDNIVCGIGAGYLDLRPAGSRDHISIRRGSAADRVTVRDLTLELAFDISA